MWILRSNNITYNVNLFKLPSVLATQWNKRSIQARQRLTVIWENIEDGANSQIKITPSTKYYIGNQSWHSTCNIVQIKIHVYSNKFVIVNGNRVCLCFVQVWYVGNHMDGHFCWTTRGYSIKSQYPILNLYGIRSFTEQQFFTPCFSFNQLTLPESCTPCVWWPYDIVISLDLEFGCIEWVPLLACD